MKRRLAVLLVSTMAIAVALGMAGVRLASARPASQTAPQEKPTAGPTLGSITIGSVSLTLQPRLDEGPKEPVSVVMSQNFEGAWPAAGWSRADQSSDDGGEYLWGKRNCHPHTGSYGGWAVGDGAQGSALSCADTYPDYTNTWAEYGPFDLSNATSASLTYHFWGRTEGGEGCPYDLFFAGSSINATNYNGQAYCGDWTGGDAGNGYYQRTLDLSGQLGQSQVWIAFALLSDLSVTDIGITIDDISLNVTGSAPTNTWTPTRTPTRPAAATATPTRTRTPSSGHFAVRLPLIRSQLTSTPTRTPTVTPTSTPTQPAWSIWGPAGLSGRGVRAFAPATNGVLAGGERIGSGPGGVAQAPGCSTAWTTRGLADNNVFALARTTNGRLYAGTYGNGVYRSTDNGATWNPVNNGLTDTHIYGLAAHPTEANILLAASLEQGVFRSTNGGDSWQRISSSGADNMNTVAFDPTNGAFAFAGTFDHGLYKSQDGGASFHASSSGLTNNRVWAIASAPSSATTVYAGTSDGLFRSTNRGDSWQRVGLAANEVRALAVDPQNANRVYAGTKSGRVWLTNNGGASWQDASSGLPAPRSIWVLKLDLVCNRLLAGTSNGIYQLSLSGQVPTPTPTRVPTVTPTPTMTPVGGSWTTIATENFEGTFPKSGWRTFDNYVGEGEYYWAKRTCWPAGGNASGWAVGGGANGNALACSAEYPNYASSWIVYGPFSLVGAADAEVVFQRWIATELCCDGLFWGASIDGTHFSGMDQRGDTGGWQFTNFDLTNVYTLGNLLGQPQVWIAVRFFSDYSVTYPEGSYVDDISVRKRTTLDASGAGQDQNGPTCTVEFTDAVAPETLRCASFSLDEPAGRPR